VDLVEDREVELVVDDEVQGVLEAPGKDLLLKGDRDELTLGIICGLVARQREASLGATGLILSNKSSTRK